MLGEFTFICTGIDQHNPTEVARLSRSKIGTFGDPTKLATTWDEWESHSSDRNRGNRLVRVQRPPKVGNSENPWIFYCARCPPRGAAIEDYGVQISDENVGRIVVEHVARGIMQFDIAIWKKMQRSTR